MNIISILAVTLASALAFARPIPQNQLAAYKEAVNMAISNGDFVCVDDFEDIHFFERDLKFWNFTHYVTAGDVSSNGSQPILTFTRERDLFMIKITTSADLKSIVLVEWSKAVLQDVNVGNLEKPNIVKQPVLTDHGFCGNR